MSLELRAGILVERKQIEEAKSFTPQAAPKEEKSHYREPPAYIRPVKETCGHKDAFHLRFPRPPRLRTSKP